MGPSAWGEFHPWSKPSVTLGGGAGAGDQRGHCCVAAPRPLGLNLFPPQPQSSGSLRDGVSTGGDVTSKHLGRKNQRAIFKRRQGKEMVLLKLDLSLILSFAQKEKVSFFLYFGPAWKMLGRTVLEW